MKQFVKQLSKLWSRDIDNNISGDLYKATFLGTPAGEKVLEDLIRFFYMQSDVQLTDANRISYEQGQREVVHYILRKLSTIEDKEQ